MKNKRTIKSIVIVFFLTLPYIMYANQEQSMNFEQLEGVELSTKEVEKFIGIWRRVEKKIVAQYDETEYPEIDAFRVEVNKICKHINYQDSSILLTEKEAVEFINAWGELELLLLCAPRSYMHSPENVARSIVPLDPYDISKIKNFVFTVHKRLQCVELYRFACGGSIANIIGPCTDKTISAVTGANCITISQIDALCASVISLLKTIISELRGNQVVCP